MANAFTRSWDIMKLSLEVMKQDKELIAFPILGGIFSLLFIGVMLFPMILSSVFSHTRLGVFFFPMVFLTYFGLAFIATFFNSCVVYTAKRRFEGGNATFGESISFAFSRIHLILMWSLVSASVGLLLHILENMVRRSGGIGRILGQIAVSVLGAAWSIITVFVVPSMVYKNIGPFAAIKNSVSAVKKTWGESLIRYYGLGMVEFMFIVIGIIVFVPALLLSVVGGPVLVIGVIFLAILYLMALVTFFSVANTIFNTALYAYAENGKVPMGFSAEVIKGAFQKSQ